VLVALVLGLVFAYVLPPYPLVYMTLLTLVVFRIYFWVNTGGSAAFAGLWLLAVTLLPMASLSFDTRAGGLLVSFSYAASAVVAVAAFITAHRLFPDPDENAAPAHKLEPKIVDLHYARALAVRSSIIVLPAGLLFLNMNWSSELLVIVFTAIFSLSPEASQGRATGIKFLIANLIGGGAAVVFYWAMVAVPEYPFFVLLMVIATLAFGSALFSDDTRSIYMNPACIALLVLIGGSLTLDGEFIGKPIVRLLYVGLAVLYVVVATELLDRLFPRAPPSIDPAEDVANH